MSNNKIFTMILSGAIGLSGTSFEAYGFSWTDYVPSASTFYHALPSVPKASAGFIDFVSRLSMPTKKQLFVLLVLALLGYKGLKAFYKSRLDEEEAVREYDDSSAVRQVFDRISEYKSLGGQVPDNIFNGADALIPEEMSTVEWEWYAKQMAMDDYRQNENVIIKQLPTGGRDMYEIKKAYNYLHYIQLYSKKYENNTALEGAMAALKKSSFIYANRSQTAPDKQIVAK